MFVINVVLRDTSSGTDANAFLKTIISNGRWDLVGATHIIDGSEQVPWRYRVSR
jgi:hypothetical protein